MHLLPYTSYFCSTKTIGHCINSEINAPAETLPACKQYRYHRSRNGHEAVHNANLSFELLGLSWRIVLGVTSNVAAADVLDGNVLDVESDVVSGGSQLQCGVVHLNRLHLGGHVHRGKRDNHARLQYAGLNTTNRHCSNT